MKKQYFVANIDIAKDHNYTHLVSLLDLITIHKKNLQIGESIRDDDDGEIYTLDTIIYKLEDDILVKEYQFR